MIGLAGLRDNEAELAVALLPDEPEAAEALSARDQFLTHAYLLLACAVIEEYIEGCFERFVVTALEESTDRVAACFVPLSARFADDLIGQTNPFPTAAAACPILRGLYGSKIVRPNNGIKRKNLIALARPLGLAASLESDCEPLLGPADTLGARRGAVAHIGAVTEETRPAEARKLVLDVLDQLPLLSTLLTLEFD